MAYLYSIVGGIEVIFLKGSGSDCQLEVTASLHVAITHSSTPHLECIC